MFVDAGVEMTALTEDNVVKVLSETTRFVKIIMEEIIEARNSSPSSQKEPLSRLNPLVITRQDQTRGTTASKASDFLDGNDDQNCLKNTMIPISVESGICRKGKLQDESDSDSDGGVLYFDEGNISRERIKEASSHMVLVRERKIKREKRREERRRRKEMMENS